jgi:hypothetical protein
MFPALKSAVPYMSPTPTVTRPRPASMVPVFTAPAAAPPTAPPAWSFPPTASPRTRTNTFPPRSPRTTSLPAAITTVPCGETIDPLFSTCRPINAAKSAEIVPALITSPRAPVKASIPRRNESSVIVAAAAVSPPTLITEPAPKYTPAGFTR